MKTLVSCEQQRNQLQSHSLQTVPSICNQLSLQKEDEGKSDHWLRRFVGFKEKSEGEIESRNARAKQIWRSGCGACVQRCLLEGSWTFE